ncbi:MAG: glucosamine-6-phosphate deaminase [Actinobacteria bacterium]|nr:glucosamine-6-phosphate deaminase [Actinomycetota bacterium]
MPAVVVEPDLPAMARAASARVTAVIVTAIETRGVANVMFAAGSSQLAFLAELAREPGVEWARVVGFHMDEYLGMNDRHPASFARYMHEHVVEPLQPGSFYFLDGASLVPDAECARYAELLRRHPLDLCCLGIGENGHLAFNDPPVADFDDHRDVKVVALDDACKRQQVGEGHFPGVEAVPPYAITATIPALLRARDLVVIVSETRKAAAVAAALEGPVSSACPASILQRVEHATVYLDPASAAGLRDSRA